MRRNATVAVVIPAYNEAGSIGRVLDALPNWVDRAVVGDNGSTDDTASVARARGADVVLEPQRGYGAACLAALTALGRPDVVVFIDADFCDAPEEMDRLVDPILDGRADLVIGSRVLGTRELGALTPQARLGNWLACRLIRWIWGESYTDLGPFRAIRFATLTHLNMADRNWGWTVEMQVKAAQHGVRVLEVPVSYRRRVEGHSKISGTVRGVWAAGTKILGTIAREALVRPRRFSPVPRERLVVFTRYPVAGETKTRLIPALGPEGAAALHRAMAGRAVATARAVALARGASLEVHFAGADEIAMAAWLGPDLAYRPQAGGDLGLRMLAAFELASHAGIERTVVIGTDCPGLTPAILDEALERLQDHDAVIGPADDGGYYLLGLTRPRQQVFDGVDWGSGTVLAQTLERLRTCRVAFLPTLRDVDRPEDVDVWESAQNGGPEAERISVIIPTLNEAHYIGHSLAALAGANVECIVVDGGSTDSTPALAAAYGAKVLTAPRGRAAQMNAGAKAATGAYLLFLHADTRVSPGFDAAVRAILRDPQCSGGAFRFAIDGPDRSYRAVEALTGLRCRAFRLTYGDQGLFIRRADFIEWGGFPDVPVLEDYAFIRTLKKQGRVAVSDLPAATSPRRWQARGVLTLSFRHAAILFAYHLGVAPERLATWR